MDTVGGELQGMVEAPVPPGGEAYAIYNLVRDPEGFWRETPGTVPITNAAPASGPITSCLWFRPQENLRFLVYEVATSATRSSIVYLDQQTMAPVQVCTRRRVSSSDRGSVFLENNGWLYIFSSADAPVRWDGYFTSPVGFPGPAPAPVVAGYDQGYDEPDRGGGNTAGPIYKGRTTQRGVGTFPSSTLTYWRYGYCLTMINDIGQESPPSSMQFASGQNEDSNAVGRRMVKLKIPKMPEHIVGFRLYRTRNLIQEVDAAFVTTQATLYLLEEFSAAGGADYIDLCSDNELQIEFNPDEVGPMPLGARAATFWSSSLWLGGCPSSPSRLFYSQPLFPEQFPSVNHLEIGSSESGAIVALRSTQRGLVVFKERGVFVVRGDAVNGYTSDTISETVGCAAPRAIEYARDLGMLFLAPQGPHLLVGERFEDTPTKLIPLEGIRRTWRRYVGNLAQAVSCYNPETDEVWWHLPVGNALVPTLGIVYHLELQKWSLRTGSVGCMTHAYGRTWVGSWDDTNAPGMHVMTYGSSEFLGESLEHSWHGFFTFDEHRVVQDVELWVLATGGSAPIQLATQNDRAVPKPQTEAGRKQLLNASTRETWSSGVWGAQGTWADLEVSRLRMAVHMAVGHEVGVQFSADRVRAVGLQLNVADGIKPKTVVP